VRDREAGSNMRHRDLYSSPKATSIRMIKYRSMSWEGHVVRINETRSTCRFEGGGGVGGHEGSNHWQELGLDGAYESGSQIRRC
jgi:hypothetical protein